MSFIAVPVGALHGGLFRMIRVAAQMRLEHPIARSVRELRVRERTSRPACLDVAPHDRECVAYTSVLHVQVDCARQM